MNDKLRTLFQVGKKYTLYRINDFGLTSKQEITVTRYFDGNPVYKQRGKRKEMVLKLEAQAYYAAPMKEFFGAVFEDWDQPIKCDSELYYGTGGRYMHGNACYNFAAPVGVIREWIDTKQLNPNFDKSKVMSVKTDTNEAEVAVYSDKEEVIING